ncbi:hypothetical protein PUNSTDRAFT_137919 [Punctularia strigosozonata HHB-11173 SS5]|uniref:Uncharacterized protein n=1 Tax=Punctularia strigosozonata (strain HHB-11173) TaxID=741275 RepID=R7S5X7_PUNST|nr:uncharacterized protein PUNSTDRAFT_137919 [Punctularia strigosozonata HHB-11173 SS5]EIN05236.1 hypothetical protein PUNSTDRAFT_137919 [Punctularia strigosozonata HHB-11173 SS5]
MSGKTLSNGTMSLRFMQNAQRAKQQAEIEAAQAKVKDEAEWEVSSEVREAWALSKPPTQERQSVSYEASYIPFMYSTSEAESSQGAPSIASTSTVKVRGRRTFKKGREVTQEEEDRAAAEQAQAEAAEQARDWSKSSLRPATLSGSGASVLKPRKEKAKDVAPGPGVKKGKSARLMIYEEGDVGTDLRSGRTAGPRTTSDPADASEPSAPLRPVTAKASTSAMFLKPSGIDTPTKGVSSSKAKPSDGKRTRVDSGVHEGKLGKKRRTKAPTDSVT